IATASIPELSDQCEPPHPLTVEPARKFVDQQHKCRSLTPNLQSTRCDRADKSEHAESRCNHLLNATQPKTPDPPAASSNPVEPPCLAKGRRSPLTDVKNRAASKVPERPTQ